MPTNFVSLHCYDIICFLKQIEFIRGHLSALYSVLVHSGGVHGGHYYAFIRPTLSDQWYVLSVLEKLEIALRFLFSILFSCPSMHGRTHCALGHTFFTPFFQISNIYIVWRFCIFLWEENAEVYSYVIAEKEFWAVNSMLTLLSYQLLGQDQHSAFA